MRLRIALSLPLIATRGYAAIEVDKVLSWARKLCTEVGEDTELFRVLRLLWAFQTVRGEHAKAHEAARQLLVMAESQDAAHLRLEADRVLGSSLFYLGRMEEARRHFERAIDLYDRERDHPHVLVYGQDPGVSCLANETLTLWFMGYPERALARGEEAVSLARTLAHPYSLCYIRCSFAAWLYLFLRNPERIHDCSEEMIAVSRHQSFPLWETMGIVAQGWVRSQAWRDQRGSRRHAVEEGLAVLQEGGETFCEPELYRLKGELLWMRAEHSAGGCREAEECLVHAREAAVSQASKSLELRATMSLSRFWEAEGKREAAQRILDETRRWFSEGSETYDLKRADALRAELGK